MALLGATHDLSSLLRWVAGTSGQYFSYFPYNLVSGQYQKENGYIGLFTHKPEGEEIEDLCLKIFDRKNGKIIPIDQILLSNDNRLSLGLCGIDNNPENEENNIYFKLVAPTIFEIPNVTNAHSIPVPRPSLSTIIIDASKSPINDFDQFENDKSSIQSFMLNADDGAGLLKTDVFTKRLSHQIVPHSLLRVFQERAPLPKLEVNIPFYFWPGSLNG